MRKSIVPTTSDNILSVSPPSSKRGLTVLPSRYRWPSRWFYISTFMSFAFTLQYLDTLVTRRGRIGKFILIYIYKTNNKIFLIIFRFNYNSLCNLFYICRFAISLPTIALRSVYARRCRPDKAYVTDRSWGIDIFYHFDVHALCEKWTIAVRRDDVLFTNVS